MRDLLSKKVGVLMGGPSSEREVSLKTGKAIASALRRKGFSVTEIDISDPSFLSRLKEIDVAFIALHGKPGEDGVIQGILEFMGIPYTGAGVAGSALAMNKILTKKILRFHGIRTPEFTVLRKDNFELPNEKEISLEPPVVVKPADEGSTIGVSIVKEKSQLKEAIQKAFSYSREVIVEKYIPGRELTVGVVNQTPLPVIEIKPKKGFYDYESKYTKGLTEYLVPAPIKEEVARQAQKWALIAHRALYQRGVSRTDFRMTEAGELYVLEVNSIPGMTETSLLPKAAAAAGISFDDLVVEILKSAFE